MVKVYISAALLLMLVTGACEKTNVLHPNLVVLANPEIISFEPLSGKPGTTVKVYGNNFSDQPANITVSIGSLKTSASTHTMSTLTFVVPDTALTTSEKISISVNGKGANSLEDFTILTPWLEKNRYPGSGYTSRAFEIDNKAYLLEMDDSQPGIWKDKLWEYDSDTYLWSGKSDMTDGYLYNQTDFTIGKKAYIGLGWLQAMPESTNRFWEYDSESDQWNHKTDYPGESKSNAISFQVGGKGYVTGGNNDSYLYSMQLWEYDPVSDSWHRKNDLPFPVSNAIELSGVTYITDFDGNIYNYYPESDLFQKVTSNISLTGFIGIGLKGFLYFFEDPFNKVAWKYEIAKNLWSHWDGPFPVSPGSSLLTFSFDSIGLIMANGKTYTFTPED